MEKEEQFMDTFTRMDELMLENTRVIKVLGEQTKSALDRNADILDLILNKEGASLVPLNFVYPDEGAVASIAEGTLTLDYDSGIITSPAGATTDMNFSLTSQGKDYVRSLSIWVDKPVIIGLDSKVKYPVKYGRWFNLSYHQFKMLKITTTETTNLFVIASTNVETPLKETETENKMVHGEVIDTDGTLEYFEGKLSGGGGGSDAIGDTPVGCIQLYQTDILNFRLDSVRYYCNPTNAVTYELYLFEQASANNMQNLADVVFDSGDAQVDSESYIGVRGNKFPIDIKLGDAGKLYYLIDWTGDPGTTPGYIKIRGRELI